MLTTLGPLLLLAAGCTQSRVVGGTWERWRELGDPDPADAKHRHVRGQAYAIKLKTFFDDDRIRQAYDFSSEVRKSGQIADLWFVNRGDAVIVYTGRYPRADHPDALEKLKAVRRAEINGKRLFRKATLEPIDRGRGTLDVHDLSQFSGKRTLLLAVYDHNFGNSFRAAAEAYASDLRADHDVSIYYYHGPNQSIVSAGLFTQADFVAVDGVDRYGPRIRELQETFPTAQRNGKPLANPELNTPDQLEPTIIVRIP